MEGKEIDVCVVGLPIGDGPCSYCGNTRDGFCGMQDDFTPREINENKAAARRGDPPPHTPT